MAKRKRLPPPAPGQVPPALSSRADAVDPLLPQAGARRAPIADVAADAAANAAMENMAQGLSEARESGRMVIEVPLEEIRTDYLVRDRTAVGDEDMSALRDSLRTRGQQNPVEAVRLPDGGFGLISGWRRCQALEQLHRETGEARFGRALVLLRRPEDMPGAYLAMVEENEIRASLSHFERARIVVKSVEQGVFETDKAALGGLFGAVPRARRSKIGSFLPIVRAFDGVLQFPEALTERTGLALSRALQEDPGLAKRVRAALSATKYTDAASEQSALRKAMGLGRNQSLKGSLESNSTQKGQGDLPGLRIAQGRDGSLVLSGSALDDDLRQALKEWLRQRLER